MPDQPSSFGSELRRARLAAGLTLAALAGRVHFSKAQLSKVETGHKQPTEDLARLCDTAVGAGGALIALLPRRPAAVWRPPAPGRREVMSLGAVSVAALTAGAVPNPPGAADGTLLEVYRALFDQFRRLGQAAPPAAVLPVVAEQTRSLRVLALRCGPRTRRELLHLCSRFAEYAGWMAQEAGDNAAALRWTDHAVDLAADSGDPVLGAYARVRRGLIAYYSGDHALTVALASEAESGHSPARVRGLAAQRAAQGHALAGDFDACMRGLDRARVLLARKSAADGPELGPTHLTDPVSMVHGWSLVDLGRPAQAAELLDREVAGLAPTALRTRARYGVRQALAHALAGEVDHACALTTDLLDATHTAASATVALDLRRLSRVLGRHASSPAVRALSPLLAFALAPTAPLP